jgi:zinc D-Ala-D-Ala dipeptidase
MKIFISTVVILLASVCFSQNQGSAPIPNDCEQIIVVITDSALSTKGELVYFERKNESSFWIRVSNKIPVVIGRTGLGWGKGLNDVDSSKLPIKKEGDGRSPAGVFKLGAAFGYTPPDEMKGVKISYLPITEMVECIDDIKSEYYNQIVNRSEIKDVDWQSSEKMFFADIWYEQGIVVEHNTNPVINGAGSCIFIHNWSQPDETTAGCTEMEPTNLKKIIYWLDSSANPVLIQLTRNLYQEYQQAWQLPLQKEIP